jgi:cardiolipin synthase
MITIATAFTIVRIALMPVVMYCIQAAQYNYAFALFLIAACTDIIDGFIARKFNQITPLGSILDPIADKFLILGCFAAFWYWHALVPQWFFVALLIKEFLLMVGSLFALGLMPGVNLKADWLGKIAMLSQVTFVCWLLGGAMYGAKMPFVTIILMCLVLGTGTAALIRYAMRIKNVQQLLHH